MQMLRLRAQRNAVAGALRAIVEDDGSGVALYTTARAELARLDAAR